MITIDDPGNVGPALADMRALLGISRRGLARDVAKLTGRNEDSVNAQLWGWDHGHRVPDMRSLGPVLRVLGFALAIVPLTTTDTSEETR